MRGRSGLRARTDFRVITKSGGIQVQCRGIQVSASGIVIDRGHPIAHESLVQWLELYLPERMKPLRALARPVWSEGTRQAFKFVGISDVDRLTLAEHLDLQSRRGQPLN